MGDNSNPGFARGDVPSSGRWNGSFQQKVDSTNGNAVNLNINGGNFVNVNIDGSPIGGTTPDIGNFTTSIIGVLFVTSEFHVALFTPDIVVVGNPDGGAPAFGGLNAEAIFQDGTRVPTGYNSADFIINGGTVLALAADITSDHTASGSWNFTGTLLTGGSVVASQAYVDTATTLLPSKPTAIVVTTAALAASTYANGTSGVGATITINATGTLTIDGYVTQLNDIVLIKNESAALRNGLYIVTTAGAIGVQAVLTRHPSMNQSTEFSGAVVAVNSQGTANSDTMWLCDNATAPTVGTTAISFFAITRTSGHRIFQSGGTINADARGTIAASTGTTTLDPTNFTSLLVNISTNTTININSGYAGQILRTDIKQDATGTRIPTLGTSIVYNDSIPSFTASIAANKRDSLCFECKDDGVHWELMAVVIGGTI